jgi:hypothetical protein
MIAPGGGMPPFSHFSKGGTMKSFIIALLLTLILIGCTAEVKRASKSAKALPEGKVLLTLEALEKAGFEHFDASNFSVLIVEDYLFLMNVKDSMIVRFTGTTPEKVFSAKGQGPREMMNPASIFLSEYNQIGIYDSEKLAVHFFDLDLNYLEQLPVHPAIRKLYKSGGELYAFGDFGDGIFARLNSDLQVIYVFGNKKRKAPFKNLYPTYLYMGYLLDSADIADTSWLHVHDPCRVNVIDAGTKKVKVSMSWTHPKPPTQKDIDQRMNMYSVYYVGKHGNYYAVQNDFTKTMTGKSKLDLLFFRENGELVGRYDFPYFIIDSHSPLIDDSRVFYMDEKESLCYIDLMQL